MKRSGKRREKPASPHPLNYEDILNGFAQEEKKAPKSTGASRTDLDGLALAELLGDEANDITGIGAASGHFDAIGVSDYSELARQFEKLDLSHYSEEKKETTEDVAIGSAITGEEEKIADDLTELPMEVKPDDEDLSPEDSAGYAALLDLLDTETSQETPSSSVLEKADSETVPEEEPVESDLLDWNLLPEPEPEQNEEPSNPPVETEILPIVTLSENPEKYVEPSILPIKTEVLSIVNLAENMDTASAIPVIEDNAEPLSMSPSATESDGLDLSDLFSDEASTYGADFSGTAVLPKVEPNAAPPLETAQTGVDFLGLTGVSPQENRAPGKPAGQMEVLFEGVEMSFEDQTDDVTLAELLLAQGKKKEAAELFQQISRNKGTTFWVAKRLRALSASMEK